MFGRTVYLLAFLVSIAVVANAKSDQILDNEITPQVSKVVVGHREPDDRLVVSQFVTKPRQTLRIVSDVQIYRVGKYEEITMVKLIDRSKNGKGANARIIRGGPGFNSVKLGFLSRRGRGIKYEVKIFAKPVPVVTGPRTLSLDEDAYDNDDETSVY